MYLLPITVNLQLGSTSLVLPTPNSTHHTSTHHCTSNCCPNNRTTLQALYFKDNLRPPKTTHWKQTNPRKDPDPRQPMWVFCILKAILSDNTLKWSYFIVHLVLWVVGGSYLSLRPSVLTKMELSPSQLLLELNQLYQLGEDFVSDIGVWGIHVDWDQT